MKIPQTKQISYSALLLLTISNSALAGTGGTAFKGFVEQLIGFISGYVGLGIVIVLLGTGFWRLAAGNVGQAVASLIAGIGLASLPTIAGGIVTGLI